MLHQARYQDTDSRSRLETNSFRSVLQQHSNANAVEGNTLAEAALRLNTIINRGFARPYIDEATRGEFAKAIQLGLQGR